MSRNFNLVNDLSFQRGLAIDQLKSSHIAQQIRREKLRIHQKQQQLTPSSPGSSSSILQSQESGQAIGSRDENAVSRSGYPVLPGIGTQIYDPNVRLALPIKDGDVVPDQNVQICQTNADYILNLLQNLGTHNPVLGSLTSGSSVIYRLPVCYPLEPYPSLSFTGDSRSGEEGDKGFTAFPLSSREMQHDPVQQSQYLSQYQQEINQSQSPLEPAAFANCQSGGFYGGTCSTGKGLSLSLSFHNPAHDLRGQNVFPASVASEHSFGKCRHDFAGSSAEGCCSYLKDGANGLRVREKEYYPAPLGSFSGYSDVLKNSKFLKPAQLLLEEMCSVGKVAIRSLSGNEDQGDDQMNGCFEGSGLSGNSPPLGVSPVGSRYPSACAPTKASGLVYGVSGFCEEANEHGRKKNRLISMLDEVYKQYRHYCQQLHTALSSFESTAGLNNAAPYASFALKTLSKHFQNLKDAINGNLKFAGKVLGKERFSARCDAGNGEEMSRSPRLEDGHGYGDGGLRIGPLQLQHVWRPQRGLPERAVAVLRTWLFEHFLHPYPSDMDKQMLARQTGITRSQVSNWFINARVRLWKPMVEEIHSLETAKDSSCSTQVLDLIRRSQERTKHENVLQQQSKRLRWTSGHADDPSGSTSDKGEHAVGGTVAGVSLTLGPP